MTKRVKKVCEQVEHGLELKLRSAQAQAKILKSKLERSEKHNLLLEDTFAKYAQLSTNEKICLRPVKPRLNKSKQSGIAVIHWTDWHVAGVQIEGRQVNRFVCAFNPITSYRFSNRRDSLDFRGRLYHRVLAPRTRANKRYGSGRRMLLRTRSFG